MTDQMTAADVKRLYRERRHAEIEAARLDGRLDVLLGIERHRPPVTGQWDATDIAALFDAGRHDEITTARAAGQLDVLLGDTPRHPTDPKDRP